MDREYPEFVVRDHEDGSGITVTDPDGEAVATFSGSGLWNPAFLAFLEGLRKVPGVSVWSDSACSYLLQGGVVCDDSLKREIGEMLTPAAELRARR